MDYNRLFDQYPAIILLIDPSTGIIIDANQAAVKFYGYDKSVLTAMKIQDINQLADQQVVEEMNCAKNEKRNYFYFPHLKSDGSISEMEVHSVPIPMEDGQILFSMIYEHATRGHFNGVAMKYIEEASESMLVVDHSFRVIRANRKFEELFELQESNILGKDPREIFDLSGHEVSYSEQVNHGHVVNVKTKRFTSSGIPIDVELNGVPLLMRDRFFGAYLSYRDVTQKVKYEQRLQLFANVLENNNEGALITDKTGSIEWVNRAFCEITGYSENELLGRNPSFLQSGRHDSSFYANLWEELHLNQRWSGEIWNRRKDGRIIPESLTIHSMETEEGQKYIGIVRDLSEIKQKEKEIHFLAYRDGLTRLYNRNYFLERFHRELDSANQSKQQLGLLYMDLKGFKAINDTLGHDAGDQVLIEFSTRIRQLTRRSDVVARYGGDEFVMLLPNLQSREHAIQLANRMIAVAQEPYQVRNMELKLGVSIGIVTYPAHAVTVEGLLHHGDLAMYTAKQRGKATYHIPELSSKDEASSLNLQMDLASSLQNDFSNLEFRWTACCLKNKVLELQPIWNLSGIEELNGPMRFRAYAQAGIAWDYLERVFQAIGDQENFMSRQEEGYFLMIDVDESLLLQERFFSMVEQYLPKSMVQEKKIALRAIGRESRIGRQAQKQQYLRLKALGLRFIYPFTGIDDVELSLLLSDIYTAIDLRGISDLNQESNDIRRFIGVMKREGMNFLPNDLAFHENV